MHELDCDCDQLLWLTSPMHLHAASTDIYVLRFAIQAGNSLAWYIIYTVFVVMLHPSMGLMKSRHERIAISSNHICFHTSLVTNFTEGTPIRQVLTIPQEQTDRVTLKKVSLDTIWRVCDSLCTYVRCSLTS